MSLLHLHCHIHFCSVPQSTKPRNLPTKPIIDHEFHNGDYFEPCVLESFVIYQKLTDPLP
jgi:hypothetical protein